MFARMYHGFEDVFFYASGVEEFPSPLRSFFGYVGSALFWTGLICRDPHNALDLFVERYVERRTGKAFCLPHRGLYQEGEHTEE